jgi:chromosomal replication initiator protein
MEFSASELWSRALSAAKASMPEQSFRTWLSGSIAVGLSEGELIVEAPSAFHVEWVEDKYGDLLREILRNLLGRPIDISFRSTGAAYEGAPPPVVEVGTSVSATSQEIPRENRRENSRENGPPTDKRTTHLNERYTFERFGVGNNNQLASAASHAVAEQPARKSASRRNPEPLLCARISPSTRLHEPQYQCPAPARSPQ